jgi:hypothetical protein
MPSKTKCEAPALGDAIKRMLLALVRRAQEGDTEALEELLKIDNATGVAVGAALAAMRDTYSLGELSRVTGTSRPAVLKRSRAHAATVEP